MSELKSCCTDACNNPNTLEFGKCHKPDNNNGCGCSVKGEEEESESTTTVVLAKLTRGDFLP